MRERRWLARDLVWLVALALLVRVLTALPMRRPGYMDASYYVVGALNLYEGRGFNDPFIWNYLDDPQGIPHPSHLYWMPLSSILAYLSFLVFGARYWAAQVPFGLLSSLLPALSYVVAYDVSQSRRHAVCAGLFTVFSAFYLAYWVTPDNFSPYAVTGAFCLWALGRGLRAAWPGEAAWFAAAGAGAGLAHLARADGVVLAGVALLVGAGQIALRLRQHPRDLRFALWTVVCCLLFALCYSLVMAPWFVRNWVAIGRPLATAGTQTAWLTDYDDLFSYGKTLDLRSYLAWGAGNIFLSKLEALWRNLGQVLFAGWMIYLAPFGLIGVWRLRRRLELLPAWVYAVSLYLAMSLAFTFAGWRGGMLHSLVALLPSLYAAAMEGLDAAVGWVARRRRTWHVRQAQRVFGVAFVLFAVLLSLVLYVQGVEKYRGAHAYEAVAAWLDEHAPADARVMVNDPATFYYYGRRPAVSIPNADRETALEVMTRYGVQFLVLDGNNPSLRNLYLAPRGDARLEVAATLGSIYVFRVSDP